MKKQIIMILMVAFAFSANAMIKEERKAKQQEMFEKVKARQLEMLNKKMTVFDQLRSCVESASNRKEHKACNESAKGKLKQLHEERKAYRQKMRQEMDQMRLEQMKARRMEMDKKMQEMEQRMNQR